MDHSNKPLSEAVDGRSTTLVLRNAEAALLALERCCLDD